MTSLRTARHETNPDWAFLDRYESDSSDVVDGVAALHDIEAGSGAEDACDDLFSIDTVAARELGVALDRVVDEPLLD